ncbi:hypothetical protein BDY24DRAFT_374400 [Mrakia frigida]|uniref:uncharacterized protein n=1 Tax=Mrakia frigida TaxID=29902 RepID=UPI003FCBF83C
MEAPSDQECWICLADEEDAPSRKGIRPCHCSLVAHEHCLLVWIASKQEHTSEVRCPQCREVYRITEDKSTLFKVLDVGDCLVTTSCRIAYELSWIFATRIGFQTLRVVFGPQTRLIVGNLGREMWPHWADWGLRIVPVALITMSMGPDLLQEPGTVADLLLFSFGAVFLPMVIIPTFRNSSQYPSYRRALPHTLSLFSGQGLWPPGPGLTLLLLPFLKYAYSQGRKRIFDATLGSLVRPPVLGGVEQEALLQPPPPNDPGLILGGFAAEALAVFRPPPPPPHPLDNPHPHLLLDPNNENEDPDQPERLLLASTRDSAKKRIGAVVLMPFLVSFISSGLMWLGRYSGGLRAVLGVGVASSVVVKRGGLGKVRVNFARDPIWWRGALGAMGILVLKDSLTLLHRSLKIKQVKTRRVVGRDERRR